MNQSCSFVGCQNLGLCSNGVCNCNAGYYGTYCENRWSDANPPVWYFFRWFSVVLNILLVALSIALCVPYWLRGTVTFPRINKPIAAQLTLAGASLATVLTYSIDPFRFVASEYGYLTPSYRAGLSVISNLGLGLIACAYSFMGAAWITIRSSHGSRDGSWSVPATIMFWSVYVLSVVMAGVCAGLWMVLSNNLPDYIYYGFICLFIVVFSALICWASISTMRDLKRFAAKNTGTQRSVAMHVLVIGLAYLGALAILISTIVAPVNVSFASFIIARCFISMLVSVTVRVILAVHYRWKEDVTFSLRSTNLTSHDRESSIKLEATEL
jgi:hypothetical protein